MLLIANFHEIESPTFSQKIRNYIKGECIDIKECTNYKSADISYIRQPNFQRLMPKLFSISSNIIPDKSVSDEDIKKYGFYTPGEFLNNVAVNTVCYAILGSRVPINKRNVTFVDIEGRYLKLARILIEHFFCVNVITENKEVYEDFKTTMMNEFGAIVMIKGSSDNKEDIYISTKEEDRGSFRIGGRYFCCEDTNIRGLNISHNVNKLIFASAMTEISDCKDYLNIVADVLYNMTTNKSVAIKNVVRLMEKYLI